MCCTSPEFKHRLRSQVPPKTSFQTQNHQRLTLTWCATMAMHRASWNQRGREGNNREGRSHQLLHSPHCRFTCTLGLPSLQSRASERAAADRKLADKSSRLPPQAPIYWQWYTLHTCIALHPWEQKTLSWKATYTRCSLSIGFRCVFISDPQADGTNEEGNNDWSEMPSR